MDVILNFLAPAGKNLIWLNFILFTLGTFVLIKGSDWFVDSAILFARKLKISEVVIGLTLVSIGTSLPELAANISSVIKDSSAIAIGNVTGSNITNITLVGGAAALFMAGGIKFQKKLWTRDVPIMLGATVLLLFFAYCFPFDGNFKLLRIESGIMLGILICYMIYLFKFNKDDVEHELEDEHDHSFIKKVWQAVLFFIIGMICIFIGSELMVRNVIVIAKRMNLSEAIIGATIVAFGTSVPELAVTLAGVIKKKSDISLGNIVGSNIFNILGVLGISGLIKGIDISVENAPDPKMLFWTLPLVLFTALMLFLSMRLKWKLGRIKGIIFLLIYIGFIVINFTGIPFIPFLK